MTAKADGLWQQMGMVAFEDIRHMQSRMIQFTSHHVLECADFVQAPMCKESWARWVVADSLAFAARPSPLAPARILGQPARALPVVEEERLSAVEEEQAAQ